MTTTVSLSATITNGNSNSWGYTGSPLTVTLTYNAGSIVQTVNNSVKRYNRPASYNSRATKRAETRGYNYKLIEEKIAIDGWLDNDSGGDSAITKKNKLIAMMQSGEFCTLVWRSETFNGARQTTPSTSTPERPNVLIESMKFDDSEPRDPANAIEGQAILKCTINLICCFRRQ